MVEKTRKYHCMKPTPEMLEIETEFMNMLGPCIKEADDQKMGDKEFSENVAKLTCHALSRLGLHWMASIVSASNGFSMKDTVEYAPHHTGSIAQDAQAVRLGTNVIKGPWS